MAEMVSTPAGERQGQGNPEAQMLCLADIRYEEGAGSALVGLSQDSQRFLWRQDVAQQMDEVGNADYLIGPTL
jgi:hypothetical protein